MEVLLDGRLAENREALHDLLSEQMDFPEYYGRNLDALYDLLTQGRCATEITVIHASTIRENLGAYGTAFINTLKDAATSNPAVSVIFFDNSSDNEN